MKKELLENPVFHMAASQFDRTADFLDLAPLFVNRVNGPSD